MRPRWLISFFLLSCVQADAQVNGQTALRNGQGLGRQDGEAHRRATIVEAPSCVERSARTCDALAAPL